MTIFYRAKRVGRYNKSFVMYKFRTMVENAERIGGSSTAADDLRITKLGKFLRKWKIDELPQIWNIIKRDMNLMGPRSEVKEYIELMTEEERKVILSVRPGIVDLASLWDFDEGEILKGSKDPEKDYKEKIWPIKKKLQIEYIKNHSLLLDIKILLCLILKLLRLK